MLPLCKLAGRGIMYIVVFPEPPSPGRPVERSDGRPPRPPVRHGAHLPQGHHSSYGSDESHTSQCHGAPPSYGSHGIHGAHGSHGIHGAHGSHSTHGIHGAHGSHITHGIHVAHGSHITHGIHVAHSSHLPQDQR